jgi:hypothetical protein
MPKSARSILFAVVASIACIASQPLFAQSATGICPRPAVGSIVEEPEDLRSHNGVLEIELTAENAANQDGTLRFCFTDAAGRESPNLRVSPGDLVILRLKNSLTNLPGMAPSSASEPMMHAHSAGDSQGNGNPCSSGMIVRV